MRRGLQWAAALIASLAIVGGTPAQTDPVEVQAYVRPASGITEVTQVRLIVEVSGVQNPQVSNPRIGGLENLRLLSNRPGVEQSTSFVNGRVSSSYRLSYALVPEGVGSATVPSLTLTVNGKIYRTRTIKFDVQESPRGPGGRTSTGDSEGADPVFAEARLSSEEVWVGQPVMSSAFVYSALRVHDIGLAEKPSFSQFLVQPIPVDVNAEATRVQIAGKSYVVYPVRRDLLIPLGAGKYEIDPYTLQVQVQSRRDLFDLFARGTNVLRKTGSSTLRVKPLPANAPPGFGGAVGDFSFSVALDRSEAAVNDAVALRIVVQGQGSLQTVDPPAWDPPVGVKVFDPESKLETDIRNGSLYSSKSWEWVLVPLAPGEITMDGLQFAYFDPAAGVYRTREAEPLRLAVVEGDGLPIAGSLPTERSVISLDRRDIEYIKPLRGGTLNYVAPRLYQRWWFASLALAPLFWTPFLVWLGRRRDLLQRDLGLARGRRAKRRARKTLASIRRQIGEPDASAFHEGVARTLVGYVGDRFNRSPSGLTYELADDLLAGRGVDEDVRRRFRSCLETCDFARFVPSSAKAERRAEVLDEASALIDLLERAW